MTKKSILKLGLIGTLVALAFGVTIAYFQDVETSSGNKFTAGKLNLKIDSQCSYNGESQAFCTWLDAKELTNELFFNFDDVKPGDYGEDTVSLHIINNPAWVCAEVVNLTSDDNGCVKPESDVDQTCGTGEGELAENLLFTVWRDTNCDNILQPDETILVTDQPAQGGIWPIADSTTGTPLPPVQNYCLGISWKIPLSTSNIIQTDSLIGDVKFTAVQSRHMDDFKCSDLYPTPTPISTPTPTPQCQQDSDCDDGIFCNGVESCSAGGTCLISSGDPCPGPDGDISCSESCSEATKDCTASDPDGSACVLPDSPGSCFAGICQPGLQESCNGLDDDMNGLVDEGFPNTDGDEFADCVDTDDDNDGEVDTSDMSQWNPQICRDYDDDTCDECSQNPTSISSILPWPDYTPSTSADGPDSDGDGICDIGDADPFIGI